MINFKKLFLADFPNIASTINENDVISGFAFLKILDSVLKKQPLLFNENLEFILGQALQSNITSHSKDLFTENWACLHRILKTIGKHNEKLIKSICQGNTTNIQFFINDFFNIVKSFLDYSGSGKIHKTNQTLALITEHKKIKECTFLFEKLVFFLANTLKIQTIQVF